MMKGVELYRLIQIKVGYREGNRPVNIGVFFYFNAINGICKNVWKYFSNASDSDFIGNCNLQEQGWSMKSNYMLGGEGSAFYMNVQDSNLADLEAIKLYYEKYHLLLMILQLTIWVMFMLLKKELILKE